MTGVTPAGSEVIRPAGAEDLPDLTRLYNHYIAHTTISFDLDPLSVEQRRPWFDEHAETGRHRLLVAVSGEELLGYAASGTFRAKAAYGPSVETSIYLWPQCTGNGLGTRLYRALLAELATEDVHRAYAAVALPNDASVALHLRLGFASIGTFTQVGRKFGRYVDVQWFERGF